MNKQEIKVRIAPSPTGFLHLGTARTALFNYLFAKQNKGKFILRIEDTDLERSEEKFEKDIIDNLKWLGLEWDDQIYKQSERIEIYKKYIKKLLDSGQAFYCDHTKEELEKEKKEQMKRKEAPRHACDRSSQKQENNKNKIIRFRCPDKKIVFKDLIRGKLEFEGGLLGDISIAKDLNTPLYNFAVVVDDAEMGITHIIRGEDHISNTPKQILIGEALSFNIPQFAHLPLILGPDKSKMSKRHGSVAIEDYRKEGYLPEALINFMVLLGWNPGIEKEVFSIEELIEKFSLERVHKNGAIFNIQRLDWINSQYIRKMDLNELTKKCLIYLPKDIDFNFAKKIVYLEQQRIKKLSEIGELTKFFFADQLEYDLKLLIWNKMTLNDVKKNLKILLEALSEIGNFDQKSLENVLEPIREKHGTGELLWPLRVSLSGQKASPGPFEIMETLGKEKSLKRIKQAINKIS